MTLWIALLMNCPLTDFRWTIFYFFTLSFLYLSLQRHRFQLQINTMKTFSIFLVHLLDRESFRTNRNKYSIFSRKIFSHTSYKSNLIASVRESHCWITRTNITAQIYIYISQYYYIYYLGLFLKRKTKKKNGTYTSVEDVESVGHRREILILLRARNILLFRVNRMNEISC